MFHRDRLLDNNRLLDSIRLVNKPGLVDGDELLARTILVSCIICVLICVVKALGRLFDGLLMFVLTNC